MIYSARLKPQSLVDKIVSLRLHPSTTHKAPIQDPIFEKTSFEEHGLQDTAFDNAALLDSHLPTPLPAQFDPELAALIHSRIESRLSSRVRHLAVFTTQNTVILAGECSTFYTKQLAQHTAMGVLEYEQLINKIEVRTAK